MPTVNGTFLARPNRFVAHVLLRDGRQVQVHVASSGRMADVLLPGAPVVVRLHEGRPGRATAGALLMAQAGGTWVSCDTSLPGRLVRDALERRALRPFAAYGNVRPEYRYGESRIDFLLTAPELPPCLLEVKSVTSAMPDPDGVSVARFPDAPTDRGRRHLEELVGAVGEGYRAAVCFVVQRADAEAVGPWDAVDPLFGDALRRAAAAGVELHAWRMAVSPERTALDCALPLRL